METPRINSNQGNKQHRLAFRVTTNDLPYVSNIYNQQRVC